MIIKNKNHNENNITTNLKKCGKHNEDASAEKVFNTRKLDVLSRIKTLHKMVSEFEPSIDVINHDTISGMDYILESLDNVIKDVKTTIGI